jgi:agmatinase
MSYIRQKIESIEIKHLVSTFRNAEADSVARKATLHRSMASFRIVESLLRRVKTACRRALQALGPRSALRRGGGRLDQGPHTASPAARAPAAPRRGASRHPALLIIAVTRSRRARPPMSFAFLSDNRFLKAPAAVDHPLAVAGIAWDGATTNRPGARMGPRAVRQASHMLCDGIHPHFDLSPLDPPGRLGDAGDLVLPNTSLEAMRAAMADPVAALIRRHHMAWIGGDHSITLPLLRAYRAWLGRPLALLHFDAHCDTWQDHFGEPSGHGTWVWEALQEGLVIPECVAQIGIRSAGTREAREYVRDRGGQIFSARDLRGLDGPPQLAGVCASVRDRLAAHGHPPVYLTLDIDCLDPAFAPGTGTPEPGGLSTAQVLTLLEELADLPWIGMDCVEVAPAYDHAELTSLAAASFVWTYLSGRARHG